MKKLALLTLIIVLFSSFKLNNSYPCHALGDLGPCTHVQHSAGDLGPCGHTYVDSWGNVRTLHLNDVYPCVHTMHVNDIYPCTHICW